MARVLLKRPKKLALIVGLCLLIGISLHASIVGVIGFRVAQFALSAKENALAGDFDFAAADLSDCIMYLDRFKIVAAPYRIFNGLPGIGLQVRAGFDLVDAAIIVARVSQEGLALGQRLSEAGAIPNQQSRGSHQKAKIDTQKIMQHVLQELPRFSGQRALVRLAQSRLDRYRTDRLVFPLSSLAQLLKDTVSSLADITDRAAPFVEVAPMLFGYPSERQYLFLFQNNTEVRATGGFIGSYGIVKIKNGSLVSLTTENVSTLDKAAPESFFIAPPKPIAETFPGTRGWFFRDSNWSPDFPESAKRALWFYAQESGRKEIFDGVIAITPDLIDDLLEITGPQTVEGIPFRSGSFAADLEYEVEKGYRARGIPGPDRKKIIGSILEQLIKQIQTLGPQALGGVVQVVRKNLDEKQVLLYFSDPSAQRVGTQLGWSGEMKSVDGDSLMVVDSNMASLKTDAVIQRSISYRLIEQEGGRFIARVELAYTHTGRFDWKTTYYRNYVRVYVPAGSFLLRSHGFGDRAKKISDEPSIDLLDEHGKLGFGGFLVVDPGTTKRVSLEYALPDLLNAKIAQGVYTFFVQKQSGLSNQTVDAQWSFARPVRGFAPQEGVIKKSSHELSASTRLYTDQSFQVNL